jgi:SulP family sulfate permease
VLRIHGAGWHASTTRGRPPQPGARAQAAATKPATVVLDAGSVPLVDVTVADMLAQLRRDLARHGITLLPAREVGQVRDLVNRVDDADLPTVHRTIAEAVQAARLTPPG